MLVQCHELGASLLVPVAVHEPSGPRAPLCPSFKDIDIGLILAPTIVRDRPSRILSLFPLVSVILLVVIPIVFFSVVIVVGLGGFCRLERIAPRIVTSRRTLPKVFPLQFYAWELDPPVIGVFTFFVK